MSDLILPDNYKKQKLSKEFNDRILDFVYKRVRLKRTNQEIQDELRRKNFPSMDASELNMLRRYFKQMEHEYPETIAEFRKKLRV